MADLLEHGLSMGLLADAALDAWAAETRSYTEEEASELVAAFPGNPGVSETFLAAKVSITLLQRESDEQKAWNHCVDLQAHLQTIIASLDAPSASIPHVRREVHSFLCLAWRYVSHGGRHVRIRNTVSKSFGALAEAVAAQSAAAGSVRLSVGDAVAALLDGGKPFPVMAATALETICSIHARCHRQWAATIRKQATLSTQACLDVLLGAPVLHALLQACEQQVLDASMPAPRDVFLDILTCAAEALHDVLPTLDFADEKFASGSALPPFLRSIFATITLILRCLRPSVPERGNGGSNGSAMVRAEAALTDAGSTAVDSALDAIDLCITDAWSTEASAPERSKMLGSAAAVVQHAHDLMVWSITGSGPDVMARLRTQLMSTARLASGLAANGAPSIVDEDAAVHDVQAGLSWMWNIQEGYLGMKDDETAERALCRALSCTLAACSVALSPGSFHNPVGAIPSKRSGGTICEQLAAVQCLGRMAVLTAGADPRQVDSTAQLVVTTLLESLSATAATPNAAAFTPDVLLCILRTLVTVTPQLVRDGAVWAHSRVLSFLLHAYTAPQSMLGSIFLFGKHKAPPSGASMAGGLADCLEILANGMAVVPAQLQQDFSHKLLALLSEVGLVSSIDDHTRDLAALLPALATACTLSLQAGPAHLDAHSARSPRNWKSSLSMSSLVGSHLCDTHSVKLFRNVWLYCGMLGLAGSHWPEGWGRREQWRDALGRLAAATPVLIYGTGTQKEEEAVQRVTLELQPHLKAAGAHGTPTSIANTLKALLPQCTGIAPANPNNAFLLAIAALEKCRASLAPLPQTRGDPLPLEMVLAYLAGVPRASPDYPVYAALVQSSFDALLTRLAPTGALESGKASSRTPSSKRLMHFEMLAEVLLSAIWSGEVLLEDAAIRPSSMLSTALEHCPSLYYSQHCIATLLESFGSSSCSDDGRGAQALVEHWTEVWLERAAQRAPTHIEHILQRFVSTDTSAAGEAAKQRAAQLSLYIFKGRMLSALPQWSKAPGVSAVHLKSLSLGQVEGMTSLATCDIEAQVASRLEAAISSGRRHWTPELDALCLQGAAVVLDSKLRDKEHVPLRLLSLLCQAPLLAFNSGSLKTATFVWAWIAADRPHLLDALMVQMLPVWQSSVLQRKGLFAGAWKAVHPPLSSGDLSGWNVDAQDEELIEGISAHHIWLVHLLELWECQRHKLQRADSPIATVLLRILTCALANASAISDHPYARPALFRLLSLGLHYCRHLRKYSLAQDREVSEHITRLQSDVLVAALRSFERPISVKLAPSADRTSEQSQAMAAFLRDLHALQATTLGGPSQVAPPVAGHITLLLVLCQHEADMQKVVAEPLAPATAAAGLAGQNAAALMDTAWAFSPAVAASLAHRYSHIPQLERKLEHLVVRDAQLSRVQAWASGATYLVAAAGHAQGSPSVQLLETVLGAWKPASVVEALQLLKEKWGSVPCVKAYCMRCLSLASDDELAFWLPQLIQCLRTDDGSLSRFLVEAGADPPRWLFLHRLIWALETEERPTEEEFNPAVKRSGWQPPEDTGLWTPCAKLKQQVLRNLDQQARDYFEAEHATFQQITDISGILKPFPKEERKDMIAKEAAKISIPRPDLYLPVDPHKRLISIIPQSGTPLQSAAKVPILLAFQVEEMSPASHVVAEGDGHVMKQACIFKVGDDCRQDVLALQVITVIRNAFRSANLPLYLSPYGVLPTGYERGIIEVVPNAKSRAGLGELSDGGLYEIFQQRYGAPGGEAFEDARQNFILSEAGYAVASFLLQSKDRHNGNILINDVGHIVHIDFGFILEISPGGNLGFESAAFKMSHEMVQLIDPGARRTSVHYQTFKAQCVRGYLAARTVAKDIIAIVSLMADSRLPCYARGKPIENLRDRLCLNDTTAQAAAFMASLIDGAYNKWTTGFYDYIQVLQNDIPM